MGFFLSAKYRGDNVLGENIPTTLKRKKVKYLVLRNELTKCESIYKETFNEDRDINKLE